MPVVTSSSKLRTYTTARYFTDDEICWKSREVGDHGEIKVVFDTGNGKSGSGRDARGI